MKTNNNWKMIQHIRSIWCDAGHYNFLEPIKKRHKIKKWKRLMASTIVRYVYDDIFDDDTKFDIKKMAVIIYQREY